jgi:hypothetical protein
VTHAMTTFPAMTALLLFPAMVVLLEVGRRLRKRHGAVDGSSAVEGAIFGLFGLLLAFTFSGAISRYDNHRVLMTEEVNDIGTAYLRLDLVPPASQPALRQLFRDYTNSRLHLFDTVGAEISPDSARLQRTIWKRSLAAATSQGANPDAVKLLAPALNDMIDITSKRQNAFNMHPPSVVYWLLFAFSCGSALMAGYSMKAGPRDWVYMIMLTAAVTLTVYTILDVEYPRQGLIHLRHMDQSLIQLRDSMK